MPSFATDVKPLFREKDRQAMLKRFDLWEYDDVKTHADAILASVAEGKMPCDGRWSQDEVTALRAWVEGGREP